MKKMISILIALFIILICLWAQCRAQPKSYIITRYCEVDPNRPDSCRDVNGRITLTNTNIWMTINSELMTFTISDSFKLKGNEYYHLAQPWYDGFFMISDKRTEIVSGITYMSGMIDIKVMGEGWYTARLSLKDKL